MIAVFYTSPVSDTLMGKNDSKALAWLKKGEKKIRKVKEFTGKDWEECSKKYDDWRLKFWWGKKHKLKYDARTAENRKIVRDYLGGK